MLEGQIEELEILNDEIDERNVQLEIEKWVITSVTKTTRRSH